MKPTRLKPLLTDWQWQARAACRGMDSSVFFSPPNERGTTRRRRERNARRICQSCAVRTPCARFALETAQPYGVWGGLTETEREAEHRQAG
ncbi:WhiB family transcriptional regulator [Peterkaempfera griseoplana]|uniref:WhiB family transcriptional regulator n=1 Tax=Peterkaempfera griseoplana TaxID=66896 RepID=UPI0006E21F1D|nr:WhiB family transcriptional regulator [Peterkaempfera griseoplana]